MAPYTSHDMATRAQVVTLKALGLKNSEIEQQTGIQPRTINYCRYHFGDTLQLQ